MTDVSGSDPAGDATAAGDGGETPPGSLTTSRVEAFSDAIIAIAATLLVIELTAPAPGEDVWRAVGHELPSIAAFGVSFLTILIFWVNHHALFAAVRRADRGVLFLNGLLLLAVSFISYPTAVLGRALQDGSYARSAAILYTVVLIAASGAFAGLWIYLHAHADLLEPVARARVGHALRRSLVGPTLYLIALLAALVHAGASLVVVALIAGYFALPPRHGGRRAT